MTIETILERISTKTGSLNWQPTTLKIAPAVPAVCGEKHYFGTTCTLVHSTVPVNEQIKNKKAT